jgi:hypothetical protein
MCQLKVVRNAPLLRSRSSHGLGNLNRSSAAHPQARLMSTEKKPKRKTNHLFSVPFGNCSLTLNLLLQLKNTVKSAKLAKKRRNLQCFSCGRTSRNVAINRNNSVTTTYNCITVMIITSTVCTTAHGNDPLWIRHLVVYPSQCRSHFVCKSSSNNHDISLSR